MIFWLEVNFFHFKDTPASERYFLSNGNVFLNEFFIPYDGDLFTVFWKPFSRIQSFFFQPSMKLVETNLFGKDFVPVEREPSRNCFLLFRALFLQMETFTKTN